MTKEEFEKTIQNFRYYTEGKKYRTIYATRPGSSKTGQGRWRPSINV